MKKILLSMVLFSASVFAAGEYPNAGVFGEIGDSFEQVAVLNQQIIDAIDTFTTTCCN